MHRTRRWWAAPAPPLWTHEHDDDDDDDGAPAQTAVAAGARPLGVTDRAGAESADRIPVAVAQVLSEAAKVAKAAAMMMVMVMVAA
eukprot:2710906-Pleurochrysis_carterae.AAC.2